VLGVLEHRRLHGVAELRRLGERQPLGLRRPQSVLGGLSGLHRVNALPDLLASLTGPLTGLLERHVGISAQPHVGAAVADLDP
jgi:hypothetical protein